MTFGGCFEPEGKLLAAKDGVQRRPAHSQPRERSTRHPSMCIGWQHQIQEDQGRPQKPDPSSADVLHVMPAIHDGAWCGTAHRSLSPLRIRHGHLCAPIALSHVVLRSGCLPALRKILKLGLRHKLADHVGGGAVEGPCQRLQLL